MATTDATAAAAPAAEVLHPCGLTLDERFKLMRSVGEECIADAELMNLLAKKPEIRCYDGFEPSGRMHIAQGIFKAINVNKCTRVGCKFTFWVADWFALMNDKMGGELDKIRVVGQYLTEVWTAAGMDMTNVDFRWSSDDINKHAKDYWIRVIDIGRNNTIARMKKCCQIMGRTDGSLSTAQLLYPLMQCADIFHLKADVCQLGKDQRKVNMLAREYCDAIGRKLKPVILSHHMLTGLVKGQGKMSKSNPMSAIFMEDTAEDVALKINAAHCPRVAQGEAKYTDDGELIGSDDVNPCLDYVNCTAFAMPGGTFTAGGRTFTSYAELETAFVKEELSEADLKAGLIDVVNGLLEPVREHFRTNERARAVLEQVKSFRNASAPAAAPAADAAAQQPKATTPRLVAWLPAALKIPLFDLVALTESLNRFAAQSEGHEAVLVLPDWTGYAQTAVGGDEKDINAALDLHAKIMVALGLSPKVQIKRQSDVILADPNAYWLNVIAAGRRFPLSTVEAALGPEGAKDAGFVVAALMRVADVVAFNATEGLSFDADGLHTLAAEFTNGIFKGVSAVAECRPTLCDPKSAPTIADDWLYADEGDMDIRRKLKRAFAAPQDNTSTVAQMACFFAVRKGLAVVRPEANGGNKNYDSAAAVLDDCASGALHPGDLKAAVSNDLMALTQPIRDFLGSAEGKKLVTALKAAEKKVAKGKK